jgi:predicted amidohydrolase YtcJ
MSRAGVDKRSVPGSGAGTIALHGGNVVTLNRMDEAARAVLIRRGRVALVGDDAAVLAAAPEGARRVNLRGCTVIPGMTDSHLHLLAYGLTLQHPQLGGCDSVAGIRRAVGGAAAVAPPGEWIVGRGWDQELLAERRFPTREDLDQAAPGHPVLLTRCCGHASVANSPALAIAGVTRDTPDPLGGRIERDAEGQATGVLIDRATALVAERIPPATFDQMKRALALAIDRALAAGLVAVHPDDVGAAGGFGVAERLYRELAAEGREIRVYQDVAARALPELLARGLATGDGDDLYRVGAVKLFADGSLGARSAALRLPYEGTGNERGLTIHDPKTFSGLVLEAHRAGMQVAVHAIGDRAMDLTLDAIEAALAAYPRLDHRHRVVHCQIMSADLFDRFARLGVVADIQPRFLETDMRWAEERVGVERCRTSYAWRSLLKAGVPVAGGSDAPVEPIEPLLGVYAAVTRERVAGGPPGGWFPGERLSAKEALRLFCQGGAYAAFEEGTRGTIEPGRLGDLTVLSGNPLTCRPEELHGLVVEMTILGGRIVHSKGRLADRLCLGGSEDGGLP